MITSWPAAGRDALVEDVEAVREEHRRVRLEVRLDPVLHTCGCTWSGSSIATSCAPLTRVGTVPTVEPGRLGLAARGDALAQADLDLDAGVAEIERVGVALAAVADDRDLAVEQGEVAVAEDRRHAVPFVGVETAA